LFRFICIVNSLLGVEALEQSLLEENLGGGARGLARGVAAMGFGHSIAADAALFALPLPFGNPLFSRRRRIGKILVLAAGLVAVDIEVPVAVAAGVQVGDWGLIFVVDAHALARAQRIPLHVAIMTNSELLAAEL
jgi:hypothetical protein